MVLEAAKTTFVTAFIDLGEQQPEHRSPQSYLADFLKLARTGIPIHLFVSYSYIPLLLPLQAFSNLYVEPINLSDLALASVEALLPPQRNVSKDTRNFMILMNAKVEFIDSAVTRNHFGTDQFAWIDFRIFHVLHDEIAAAAHLRQLAILQLKQPAVLIPGCWAKGVHWNSLFQSINWRFCGGFFLGDAVSLHAFYRLYVDHIVKGLTEQNPGATLTWEVNYWHYLELNYGFKPIWYKADHDASILQVPSSAFIGEEAEAIKLPATLLTERGKAPESETSNAL